MNLKKAQEHIKELFSKCDSIRQGANIVLRYDTPNQTIVLHCYWALVAPKPGSRKSSREITFQLDSSATQRYLDADDEAIQNLDKIIQHIVQTRLKNEYGENDTHEGPFIIRINKYDLDY